MANSKLLAVSIERFKSHAEFTRIDFGLLNVVVGRNNSGKSSVIQALLLLKQTLEFSRLDVPLRLEGYVDAYSIRELTYGWPDTSDQYWRGPSFAIEWQSTINVAQAIADLGNPDISTLGSKANLPWLLSDPPDSITTTNCITLDYGEQNGKTVLHRIRLESSPIDEQAARSIFRIERDADGSMNCYFGDEHAKQLLVSLEHFIPFISIDRRNAGPRDRQRSWANAFYVLFVQSLEDLKSLIKGFAFLSSTRQIPRSLYSPTTEPIDNIGVSGEYAAQLLQSHQSDYVHYLLPQPNNIGAPPDFRQERLVEAVNNVLLALGVDSPVSIDEIKNVGFRLLFGRANIQHVGRGLTYLLPLIQLGLVSDPMRYKFDSAMTTSKYDELSYAVCAFEEPEAHLHPKVQSNLAQWFVALAMGRRQVIVETHSDHLIRKLRLMIAKSPHNSPTESWLMENVKIITVEQSDGKSRLGNTTLTREGGMDVWPSDFMDESTGAEQEIYFAAIEKSEPSQSTDQNVTIIHHESGEPIEGNS